MPVKIADIAKLAGISSASVSRILNKTGRYSEETAARVKKIAKDIGYYKDRSAADLAQKNNKTIGVIYTNSKTNFNNIVINGVMAEADEHGLDIILMATKRNDPKKLLKTVRNMIERRVNALLLISLQPTSEVINMLKQVKINTKLVGTSTDKDIYFVSSNDFLMGYQATKSLIRAGYKKIGMAGSDIMQDYVARLRYKGYLKALGEAKIKFQTDWLSPGNFSYDSGIESAAYFHEKKNVSAIIGVSDEVSLGLLNGLHDLGDTVPADFSIVSIDGTEICTRSRPQLTSITQNFALMGKIAVTEFQNNKQNVLVPFKLVQRSTTKKL
ncbi:LacI family DNA-binding transcriptional regulator [Liquorilactobacillus satsumensis]|uniref:Transcriptional regulator, LacI family n=1 Tax=Liquorilactobacillus satsumensis DSM 16230 = JCM 12392 TaxID=1423801 RepID=A0A0R1UZK7_9LACO|nr:LacI family DNA-binding transcriptional regulator [Liquorilactobacillus satsumensis]KRL98727.1 transcriptional regulator, LacI family [Liquorilactobacillus satsumensis DSM 16230 = JCM 12392]